MKIEVVSGDASGNASGNAIIDPPVDAKDEQPMKADNPAVNDQRVEAKGDPEVNDQPSDPVDAKVVQPDELDADHPKREFVKRMELLMQAFRCIFDYKSPTHQADAEVPSNIDGLTDTKRVDISNTIHAVMFHDIMTRRCVMLEQFLDEAFQYFMRQHARAHRGDLPHSRLRFELLTAELPREICDAFWLLASDEFVRGLRAEPPSYIAGDLDAHSEIQRLRAPCAELLKLLLGPRA